jgi:hypothetical protein
MDPDRLIAAERLAHLLNYDLRLLDDAGRLKVMEIVAGDYCMYCGAEKVEQPVFSGIRMHCECEGDK